MAFMGSASDKTGFLDGHLIMAMPSMGDPRFDRTVIYLCAHSSAGAMGIIVNKTVPDIRFRDLLVQLDIVEGDKAAALGLAVDEFRVHRGGPVETGRGFVLHSADFFLDHATLPVDDGISLTATLEILRAIAEGRGPREAFLALGYAGWAPGQLETEIQANGWLHAPVDKAILFDADNDTKYERALAKIGVHPGMLSMEAGHA